MSGSDPVNTTMCVDSTTYSTQSNNPTCAAQGTESTGGRGRGGAEEKRGKEKAEIVINQNM